MTVQITVPDIGDFADVEVIEVLVSEGDTIEVEQGIVTVESDKASMELPADTAGKVVKVLVKVGDKINKGDPLVEVEASGASESSAARGAPSATVDTVSASGQTAAAPADQAASAVAPAASAAQAGAGAAPGTSAAPTASSYSGNADIECDVLVLGAG